MTHTPAVAIRTAADLADSTDLRSVISTGLAESPIDEEGLRRGVWTYVGVERDAGVSPGDVIIALTELVDGAHLTPMSNHTQRLRQLILWCVEAYFGHLGGEAVGGNEIRGNEIRGDVPRQVSNR